jgi:hypothetical protein
MSCKYNLGVAPWIQKFSRLNVLFICYGTAVEHMSVLNRSGICDGINRWGSSTLNVSIYLENRQGIYFSPQKRLKHGRQNITLNWINGIIRNNSYVVNLINFINITLIYHITNQVFAKQIMWHSRLMIYIPFGCASGNIDPKPGISHYIPCLIAE